MTHEETAGKLTSENDVIKENLEGVGEVSLNTKTMEIIIPADVVGDEAIAKYKAKVKSHINVGNQNYKDRMEINQKKQSFESEKARFDNEIAEAKQKLLTIQNQIKTTSTSQQKSLSLISLYAEAIGHENPTDEEINDLMIDDPTKYRGVYEKYNQSLRDSLIESNNKIIDTRFATSTINDTIRRDGYSISEVEAFKLNYGITDTSKAYELFKASNSKAKSTKNLTLAERINSANSDGKSITFIKSGDFSERSRQKGFAGMTKDQVDSLPIEEFKIRMAEERQSWS